MHPTPWAVADGTKAAPTSSFHASIVLAITVAENAAAVLKMTHILKIYRGVPCGEESQAAVASSTAVQRTRMASMAFLSSVALAQTAETTVCPPAVPAPKSEVR